MQGPSPQTTAAFHRCLSAQACRSFGVRGSSHCVSYLEDASGDSFCTAAISRLGSRDPGTGGRGASAPASPARGRRYRRVWSTPCKGGRRGPGIRPGLGGARVLGARLRGRDDLLGAWLRGRVSGGRAGRPQASGRRPDSTASPGSPGPRGRRPLAAPGVRLPPRERRARWPRGRRHRRGAHALGRPPRALPTGGERGRLLEPFSTYYILERMAVYRDSFFFLQLHSYSNCLLINIGLFLLLPWCHKESFSSRVASHFGHYASGISS